MVTATYHVGDVFEVLASLPEHSVDLVLTSPPFLALRSYLPDDDPAKAQEIGSEATPAEFIDRLLDVVDACDRVLAPHGSLAFELGDTYSGSGGAGGDYNEKASRAGQPKFSGSALLHRKEVQRNRQCGRDGGNGWPLAKSLTLVPESFRWALAYGRNPFTGRETPPWRVRNVVRWVRPNPPVGALGDKFRPATSEMVIACKSDRRWFDLDAVRSPYSPNTHARTAADVDEQDRTAKTSPDGNRATLRDRNNNGAGAPPLDWWEIPTQGYPGSHYATWPEQLCVRPILSMCPRRVCTTCGEPSRRITEPTDAYAQELDAKRGRKLGSARGRVNGVPGSHAITPEKQTVGWSDCGHDTWRTGIVLDPFAGSGTTLKIATGHGREAIGIDLDHRNATLAEERVGPMFLTIEHLSAAG